MRAMNKLIRTFCIIGALLASELIQAQPLTNSLSPSAVQTNASVLVMDDAIDAATSCPTGLSWDASYTPSDYDIFSALGAVRLYVDHSQKLDLSNKLEYQFDLSVETIEASINCGATVTDNISLVIEYDPRSGYSYKDMVYKEYADVHYIEASIVQITDLTTNTTVTDVEDVFRLKTELTIDRKRKFNPAATTNYTTCTPSPCDFIDVATSSITFKMPSFNGASYYDLEWTYIDPNLIDHATGTHSIGTLSQLSVAFENNATRVRIPAQSGTSTDYTISNTFDGGYIAFRFQAWGKQSVSATDYTPSGWMPKGYPGTTTANVYPGAFIESVGTHEGDKNWQFVTTFAEDGKKKEVLSYSDGLNRGRQVVTQVSSDGTTVVGQSIYDHEGRPAIQVLPTPVENKDDLTYVTNLNQNSSSTQYGAEDFDGKAAEAMSTSSGASRYYSDQNGFNQSHNDYIPDAGGYPFAQTIYTQDQTGRVLEQTGVGPDHQIGGHTTSYQYASADATNLASLFGSNIGVGSHYKQVIVTDPNGQMSTSYVDQHGRTIATSLASGAPSNMQSLGSALTPAGEMVENLHQSNPPIEGNPIAYELTYPYVAKEDGDHYFWYEFQPEKYEITCSSQSFCADCNYKIEIEIVAEDGTVYHSVSQPVGPTAIDATCVTPQVFKLWTGDNIDNSTFSVSLLKGKYYIFKRLSIDTDNMNAYWDLYLNGDNCLFDYDHFYDLAFAQTAPCTTETEEEPIPAICSNLYYSMLTDVSPNGQYGSINDLKDANGDYVDDTWINSVFKETNNLSNYKNVFWQYDDEGTPALRDGNWRDPATPYLDENGDRTLVQDIDGSWVYPEDMKNRADFVAIWKSSYAESLLPYHPEYPYYQACLVVAPSFEYDDDLLEVETLADAKTAGYYDDADDYAIVNEDPIIKDISCLHWNGLYSQGLIERDPDCSQPFVVQTSPLVSYSDYDAYINDLILPILKKGVTQNGKYYENAQWHYIPLKTMAARVQCMQYHEGNSMAQKACQKYNSSHFANTNMFSEDYIDDQWLAYRKLYLASKSEYIYEAINNLVAVFYPNDLSLISGSPVSNSAIGASGQSLEAATARFRFDTHFKLTDRNNDDVDFDATDASDRDVSNMKTKGETVVAEQWAIESQAVCAINEPEWREMLALCPSITTTQIDNIVLGFIEVCRNSFGPERLMGGSSVDPNATLTYTGALSGGPFYSFDEVMAHVLGANYQTTYCNWQLMADGLPGHDDPLFIEKTKEDGKCACEFLKDLVTETVTQSVEREVEITVDYNLFVDLLNGLILRNEFVAGTTYVEIDRTPNFDFVYTTEFIDLLNIPLSTDRAELFINHTTKGDLELNFRKKGGTTDDAFSIVIFKWGSGAPSNSGTFSLINGGSHSGSDHYSDLTLKFIDGSTNRRLYVQGPNIETNKKRASFDKVISEVSHKLYSIKGLDLTHGEIVKLIRACEKQSTGQWLDPELIEVDPGGISQTQPCVTYYSATKKQRILIKHINEIIDRGEMGAQMNHRTYKNSAGDYDYLIDNGYSVYMRNMMMQYKPYHNYATDIAYDKDLYDDPVNQKIQSSNFIFGVHFGAKDDGLDKTNCWASIAYFDAIQQYNNPITASNILKVSNPHPRTVVGLSSGAPAKWAVDVRYWDPNAAEEKTIELHYVTCDDGDAGCFSTTWLDPQFDASCVFQQITEDADFACDCDVPMYHELLNELHDPNANPITNSPVFNPTGTAIDVSNYAALINETQNHLKKYNTSTTSDYEYKVVSTVSGSDASMTIDFGDMDGEYCTLVLEVPEGATWTLEDITSFDGTELDFDKMAEEAKKGTPGVEISKGYYKIEVTVNGQTEYLSLYTDCKPVKCIATSVATMSFQDELLAKLPCPSCTNCEEMEEGLQGFVSDYPDIGYNHPLFTSKLTGYLNTLFGSRSSFQDYAEFISNCKLIAFDLPTSNSCHFSFQLPIGSSAHFNSELSTYETTFESTFGNFIKYTITDDGTNLNYCFDFSNLSPIEAGSLRNALLNLNTAASTPLSQLSPAPDENETLDEVHLIRLPNAVSLTYSQNLTTELSQLSNLVTVQRTTGSVASNNTGTYLPIDEIEIDYSAVNDAALEKQILEKMLEVMTTTNEAEILLGQLYYAYRNDRHEGFEICNYAEATCTDCESVREGVLNFQRENDIGINQREFEIELAADLSDKLGYQVQAIKDVDDCATCTDRSLYICGEPTVEAIDMQTWLNHMALSSGLVNPIGLSNTTEFITASFYPNVPTDNPHYDPVVQTSSSGYDEMAINVTDQQGYELNIILWPATDDAVPYASINKISDLKIRPSIKGDNYQFSVIAENTTLSEKYTLNGYVDGFSIASCCFFDDLELCYSTEMPTEKWEVEPCEEYRKRLATANADILYNEYLDKERAAFEHSYIKKCGEVFSPDKETFQMKYQDVTHHRTLYYYDQAGNLVQTVPPKGVKPLDNATAKSVANQLAASYPAHDFTTQYQYNSLNQLIWQSTPDGGEADFYYDQLGRLVFSQNANQADAGNVYSYTQYDPLGRVIESGETKLASAVVQATFLSNESYQQSLLNVAISKTEVTYVNYDATYSTTIDAQFGSNGQENLRNRVSSTYYKSDATNTDYDYATHYSYDIHGMAKTVIQEFPELDELGHRYKRIDYEYDLVSGNVNYVYYQKDEADQFIHRYNYDADNRVTEVYTSRDGKIWDKDASYNYYLHGPLARTVIGDNEVQGLDYAYTIHGWLKGVNAATLDESRDPGQDDGSGIARDAMGYNLHYYNGDYTSIGTTSFLPTNGTSSTQLGHTTGDLYNGNISAMTTGNRAMLNEGKGVLGMGYKYDQLNRLVSSTSYLMDATAQNNNSWAGIASANKWSTAYSYDANGNLLNTFRRGHKPIDLVMDDLDYHYLDGTNKLLSVVEEAHTSQVTQYTAAEHAAEFTTLDGGVEDINPGQLTPTDDADPDDPNANYKYDKIGNLIKDVQEEIDDIEWTVSGKVAKVKRTSTSTKADLEFAYGPGGNRVRKLVKKEGTETDWAYQYYVRDANGQVMAIYEKDIQMDNFAMSYFQIGSWVEAYNSGGQAAVKSIVKTAYADYGPFKASLITQVMEYGVTGSVAASYGVSGMLLVAPELSQTMITTYDNDAASFDFLLPAMINNTTFKDDFIEGLWHTRGEVILEALLTHDINNDFLNCFTLSELNQFIICLTGTTQGSVSAAINHLKTNYTDSQIATCIHSTAVAKTTLKNCPSNTLLTNAWTYGNLSGLYPSATEFLDDIGSYLDQGDLVTWWNTNPDPIANRTIDLLSQQEPYLMLSTLSAKDGFNFIEHGLNALTPFFRLYQQVMPGTEDYRPEDFAHQVKVQLGQTVYDQMMSDIADNITYQQTLTLADLPIYGSSRVGVKKGNLLLKEIEFNATGLNTDGSLAKGTITTNTTAPAPTTFTEFSHNLGHKQYELANHLGNVLVTISDKKVLTEIPNDPDPNNWLWDADIITAQDYYPFGMLMPDRVYSNAVANEEYRFGFNGMEMDNDANGTGNSYTTDFRQYDSRLGRWLSIDPLAEMFASLSPYVAFDNNPIYYVDPHGLSAVNPPGTGNDQADKENEGYQLDEIVIEDEFPGVQMEYTLELVDRPNWFERQWARLWRIDISGDYKWKFGIMFYSSSDPTGSGGYDDGSKIAPGYQKYTTELNWDEVSEAWDLVGLANGNPFQMYDNKKIKMKHIKGIKKQLKNQGVKLNKSELKTVRKSANKIIEKTNGKWVSSTKGDHIFAKYGNVMENGKFMMKDYEGKVDAIHKTNPDPILELTTSDTVVNTAWDTLRWSEAPGVYYPGDTMDKVINTRDRSGNIIDQQIITYPGR